jgi:tetratricopeptide (TPR) repeat protein
VGKTYYNQERYTKALEFFLPLSQKKQDAKLYYDIAQCYMEMDQYKKCAEYYEKALTVRYDKTWENELALVYTTAGLDGKAIERFRNVIAKSNNGSSNYSNYFNMGNTFFGMNQYDSALVYFKKAQEVNPESYELLTMLMHTYYKMKDVRSAQAAIDDVLKANPDNANAYYLLGKLYFDNGSKEKGEKYFEKAFQLDPTLRYLKVEKIVMQ